MCRRPGAYPLFTCMCSLSTCVFCETSSTCATVHMTHSQPTEETHVLESRFQATGQCRMSYTYRVTPFHLELSGLLPISGSPNRTASPLPRFCSRPHETKCAGWALHEARRGKTHRGRWVRERKKAAGETDALTSSDLAARNVAAKLCVGEKLRRSSC